MQVCDTVGAFIAYWGFKSIHGRIWTLLALQKTPMSQAEIARTLGVSRALVSPAMGELVAYGLVRAVESRRNAPYEAVVDIWPAIADVLREREWMLIEAARVALEGLLEDAELAQTFGEEAFCDIERVRLLLSLTVTAQNFLRVLVTLRVPRAVDILARSLSKVSSLVNSLRNIS